jgi:DNA-binding transcriptional ArsR family regulator
MADGSRRKLLDALYEKNGQCLSELCGLLEMSRQAASKHLSILEQAGLVVPVWHGREKLHYLNPVPIRQIYHRWLQKFDEDRADVLLALKREIEKGNNLQGE